MWWRNWIHLLASDSSTCWLPQNLFLFASVTNVLVLADLYKEPIDRLLVDHVLQEITHKDMCSGAGGLRLPQTWIVLLSGSKPAWSPEIRCVSGCSIMRSWRASAAAAASSSSTSSLAALTTFTLEWKHCAAAALTQSHSFLQHLAARWSTGCRNKVTVNCSVCFSKLKTTCVNH